ncbi:uncharacterized protein CELE_C55C3.73 [Caenorhabditis elegans]|uniref:Uncharacterized protein n=1 Tax=Caenorhabditis elegans TaxID=6239 RepID=A0A2K5ATX3_CAEEL|nr:Uncharacterized protein CELE_C55C3.73 [Caenorhabditis elegans]SPC47646.1 Uncharacterized protein CELE_C55C3.73 [Caenorhabditis elegans]|eukprot:NP_001348762.1 Uncharacterized protein CELE_C55C3.73 [Caenorhabditis elegans]
MCELRRPAIGTKEK